MQRLAVVNNQNMSSPDCQNMLRSTQSKRKSIALEKENNIYQKCTESSLQKNVKRLCLGTLPSNANHDHKHQQNTVLEKSYTNSLISAAKSLDLCFSSSQNSQDSHDSGFSFSQNFSSPLRTGLNDSFEMNQADMDELNSCCLQNSAMNNNRLLDSSLTSDSSFSARRCLFKSSPMAARTPNKALFTADGSPCSVRTPLKATSEIKKPSTPVSIHRHSSMRIETSKKFTSFAEQSITCIEKMLEDTTQIKCLETHHEEIKKSLEIECQESTSTLTLGTAEAPTHRLIGDRSKYHVLPTKTSIKHNDLSVITPTTMKKVLGGEYSSEIGSVMVIDSRYPYEFEGGHIQTAENLYTKEQIYEKFLANDKLKKLNEETNAKGKRSVIIFHCEFSSERGPSMLRFLRNQDRTLNKDSYPHLFYPELYLLEGGYKAFYEQNESQCEPQTYKPMLHKDHADDLKHFRAKTKTWNRMGSAVNMTACKSRFKPSLQRFARSTLF